MDKRLLSKAEKLRRSGDYGKAAILYKKFIKATDSAVDWSNSTHKKSRTNAQGKQMFGGLISSRRLDAFIGIADTLRIMGRFAASRKYYNKVAELLKDCSVDNKYQTYYLDSIIGVALCDKAAGKYKLALSKLKSIKKLAEEQKDTFAVGFIAWHIGMIYRFLGELDNSIRSLKESERIFKKGNNPDGEGFALCGLGGSERSKGEIKKSLMNYFAANKIFNKTKDAYGLAYSYCGLANAHKALGNFKKAMEFYQESEKLYKKVNDLSSLAFVYKGIYGCCLKTNCEILSGFYFNEAIKYFEKSNDTRGLLSLYLEKLSRNYDVNLYKKSKALAERNNLKSEVKYLNEYSKKSPQKWLG